MRFLNMQLLTKQLEVIICLPFVMLLLSTYRQHLGSSYGRWSKWTGLTNQHQLRQLTTTWGC